MEKVCVALAVIFSSLEAISACNGYTLKLSSIKNCVPNSIVKVPPGFDVTMDGDCNLSFSGCLNVTRSIKTATGTYLIKKPPLPPLDGEVDYCQAISQGGDLPQIKQALVVMGVANKCPVPPKNYCATAGNKISIGMFKNQLGLAAGTASVKLTADHDSGKTCVEFIVAVSKARKG